MFAFVYSSEAAGGVKKFLLLQTEPLKIVLR